MTTEIVKIRPQPVATPGRGSQRQRTIKCRLHRAVKRLERFGLIVIERIATALRYDHEAVYAARLVQWQN